MKEITETFLEGDKPTLSNFYLQMQNVLTTNFSYIYQWLLSNISGFTMWTEQVMDKVRNRSMNNI